ncbi:TolC family protein [Candidatus Dependentiae bacterium]|nr:TolC family protein [Candidatus Dependentiae bacterium]
MKKILISFFLLIILSIYISSETLTLETSIEIALRNDSIIKVLKEELKQAKLQKLQSYSAFYPEISAEGLYLKQGFPLSMKLMAEQFGPGAAEFGLAEDSYSASLSVTQPLFLGGLRYYGLKMSDISIKIKENEIKLRENKLKYNVKKSFYNVLIAEQFIKIYQESLELANEQLKIAQVRFESGEASDFDVLRAQVQISNLRPSLYRAENNLALTKSFLLTQLNLPIFTDLEIQGAFETRSIHQSLKDLLNEAYSTRIELQTLKLTEEIADFSVNIAKSGYYPSLIFSYGYSETNTKLDLDPDTWSASWNTAFVISIPLFKGFKTRLAVQEAKSRKESIKPVIVSLQNGISIQIKSAYLNLQSSERILESSDENIKQAVRYIEIVQTAYESGMVTSLDLMNAQFTLTQARVEQARSQYEYQVNLIELEYALGK